MYFEKVRKFFVVPLQDDEIPLITKEPAAAKTRWWKKARNENSLPSGHEVISIPAGAERVTTSDIAVTEKIMCQEVAASTENLLDVAAEDCVVNVQFPVVPMRDGVISPVQKETSAAITRKKTQGEREPAARYAELKGLAVRSLGKGIRRNSPMPERRRSRNCKADGRDEQYAKRIGWDPSTSVFRDHRAYLKFTSYYFDLS